MLTEFWAHAHRNYPRRSQPRIKVETSKTGKIEHWFDSFFEVVWPTALAYHFYVSGQLPNAFFYLALLIAAEALDGIGKLGVYVPAEKSLVGPGLFDQIVRLIGGRRSIYVCGACGLRCFGHAGKGAHCHGILGSRNRSR